METIIDINIEEEHYDRKSISDIEELCLNKMPLTEQDIEELLGYLCFKVREKIANHEGKNLQNYLFPYKCDLAQSMIYYYLRDLGVSINPVNTNEVLSNTCGHSFVLATFSTTSGDKHMLIDPTYIQFFSKEGCDSSKFVILQNRICIAPDPGYFITRSHKEKIVMPLLEKGYIEFSEDVAKAYGDSFFQTKTGISPEEVDNYTATGVNYQRWFYSYQSNLSKDKEELKENKLLIEPIHIEEAKREK